MSKKIDGKILKSEIKSRIREFYPYFLGFYLLSLLVAIFSQTWSSFFYWPAFHGSVIFFTLLFILTFKLSFKIRGRFHFHNFKLRRDYKIIALLINSSKEFNKQFRQYLTKLFQLNRHSWLKIIIVIAILIFALLKQIGAIDFLILFYALISVLFILDSRYSAGAALVFLAACPFLLIFKKDAIAESSAIFAYYFLVITVFTQIREIKKERQVE